MMEGVFFCFFVIVDAVNKATIILYVLLHKNTAVFVQQGWARAGDAREVRLLLAVLLSPRDPTLLGVWPWLRGVRAGHAGHVRPSGLRAAAVETVAGHCAFGDWERLG